MESLATDLTLSDLNDRITATQTYIDNVKLYAQQMKVFLPIFSNSADLPILRTKYDGTIAYVDWILRSDELYLCLNITYFSTGRFKCAQTLSQLLTLTELTDRRNVRTLDGKRFKQHYVRSLTDFAYIVVPERIISPKPFAIIENGLEAFKCRDKILEKYNFRET